MDVETGLYYCNARYYDPKIYQWIQRDNIEYLDNESLDGLNLYLYCNNDPVMYKDNSGNTPEWISVLGTIIENILNFSVTLLDTVLKPSTLSLKEAKVLVRKGGHLYSARELIRGREDDIANTLKLSKNISKVANIVGGALFVMDIASTWYINYNSGNENWFTDSMVDTLIDGAIFAIGFIPGWGWIASLGLSGIKYLIEKYTTWIDDLKKILAKWSFM